MDCLQYANYIRCIRFLTIITYNCFYISNVIDKYRIIYTSRYINVVKNYFSR